MLASISSFCLSVCALSPAMATTGYSFFSFPSFCEGGRRKTRLEDQVGLARPKDVSHWLAGRSRWKQRLHNLVSTLRFLVTFVLLLKKRERERVTYVSAFTPDYSIGTSLADCFLSYFYVTVQGRQQVFSLGG